MLNVAAELREMEKQTSLSFAALDESVGVLLEYAKNGEKKVRGLCIVHWWGGLGGTE